MLEQMIVLMWHRYMHKKTQPYSSYSLLYPWGPFRYLSGYGIRVEMGSESHKGAVKRSMSKGWIVEKDVKDLEKRETRT